MGSTTNIRYNSVRYILVLLRIFVVLIRILLYRSSLYFASTTNMRYIMVLLRIFVISMFVISGLYYVVTLEAGGSGRAPVLHDRTQSGACSSDSIMASVRVTDLRSIGH